MGKLFAHAEKFYNALAAESEYEHTPDGVKLLVYRGSVTQTYAKCGISQSYYSRITKTLQELGCYLTGQRGSRDNETVLILQHPPDATEFERRANRPLTQRLASATLRAQMEAVINQLGGIDLKKALIDLQRDINLLDARLRQLEDDLGKKTS